MRTILLIIAGPTQCNFKKKIGDKIDWYSRIIAKNNIEIKIKEVYLGDILYPKEGDVWIITGSEYSVCDKYSWLFNTIESLKLAISMGKPILGICFGHQLIAKVLGGIVGKNPKGWEVGSCAIELNSLGKETPLFFKFSKIFFAAETHQDSILQLPSECASLASKYMGNQVFKYSNNVFGVQFYPEFTQNIMSEYIKLRRKAKIPVMFPDISNLSNNEKNI